MTELRTLLEEREIRRALIVDDVFDEVPLPSDLLALGAEGWTVFFDDLNDDDKNALRGMFPDYDRQNADELSASNEFVEAIWRNRGLIRHELTEHIFSTYDAGAQADRAHIATLVERLESVGLVCETAGRQFQEGIARADIVFIDLFLGSAQNEAAMATSIGGLRTAISLRADMPPIVVLMSRNQRVAEWRTHFRDETGLFESTFRVLRKAEIADHGKLERVLTLLALHQREALKLAAFLSAWKRGIENATMRSANLIRTLDLPDHAQLQQMLLGAEGEPTGCYLVDVFDRVLQHEVERSAELIDAAIQLNTLTTASFPPPYISGSPDLQNLVYRCLFQNKERLRLKGSIHSTVGTGDLLRPKQPMPGVTGKKRLTLPNIKSEEVAVVLTPACDLQRMDAKTILLLVGELRPLSAANWTYADNPIRTPVVELGDGSRRWIKWDLKHIETISPDDLARVIDAENGFEIIARLRESHALELQQRLLSSLGRVGQITPMPGTFAMRVEAYVPDLARKPRKLNIPALESAGGICYVGRSGNTEVSRLILTEDACEALCESLDRLAMDAVHNSAAPAIRHLQETSDLMAALIEGIQLPNYSSDKPKDVASPSGARENNNPSANVRTICWIARNKEIDVTKQIEKTGLIIATWDEPTGR